MKKGKLALLTTGMVGFATFGVVICTSPLATHAATTLNLATYTPSTTQTNSAKPTSSNTIANPFQLSTPGPIEHYVWNHEGQTDQVWQNTQSGEWRIEKTFLDGSTQKDIFKNGYLYLMAYDASGNLQHAEKIAESASYTGKDDAFNGLKVDNSSFTVVGNATVSNVSAKVMQRAEHRYSNVSETTKMYVDTIHNLPLKVEHMINGQITGTETWEYSYQKTNDSLFAVPTSISFQNAPSADTPVKNK